MTFSTRILEQEKLPLIGLHLVPQVALLPLSIQRFDDPFLPFSKAIINASRERVSVYILDVVAYLTLGGAGAVALERAIDYLNDEIPCILHGPFGDMSFAALLDKTSFGALAITLSTADNEVVTLIDQSQIEIGAWNTTTSTLQLTEVLTEVKVVGSSLVYKSRLDDFQDVIRHGLA